MCTVYRRLEDLDLRDNPISQQSQQPADLRISVLTLIPTIKIVNAIPVKSKYGQMVRGYASAPPKKPPTGETAKRIPGVKRHSSPAKKEKKHSSQVSQPNPQPQQGSSQPSLVSSTASLNLSLSASDSHERLAILPVQVSKREVPVVVDRVNIGVAQDEDEENDVPHPRQRQPLPQPLLVQRPVRSFAPVPRSVLQLLEENSDDEVPRPTSDRSPSPPPPPPVTINQGVINTPNVGYSYQQQQQQHDGLSFSSTPNKFYQQISSHYQPFSLNESAIPFYNNPTVPPTESKSVQKPDSSALFTHSIVDLDDMPSDSPQPSSPPPSQQSVRTNTNDRDSLVKLHSQRFAKPEITEGPDLQPPHSDYSTQNNDPTSFFLSQGISPYFYHLHGLAESPMKGDQFLYRPTSPPFDTSLKPSSRSRTPSPEKAHQSAQRSWKKQTNKKVTPLMMKKLPWRKPPEPALRPVKPIKQSQGQEKTLQNIQVRQRSLSPTPLQRTNSPPVPSPPPPHPLETSILTASAAAPPKSPEQRRLEKRSTAMNKFYQWHQRAAANGQDPFASTSGADGFDVLQIHGMHPGNDQSELDNDNASSVAPSIASNSLSGMSLNPLNLNFQSAIAHKLAIIQEQEEELLQQQEEEEKRRQLEEELNTSPVHVPTHVPAASDTSRWMSPLIKGRVKPSKPPQTDQMINHGNDVVENGNNDDDEVMQSLKKPVQWERHLRSFTSPERAAASASSQYLQNVNPMKEMSQPSPTKATRLLVKSREDKKKQEAKQEALKKYRFAKNKSPGKARPHQSYYQDPRNKKYSELYDKYGSTNSRLMSAIISESSKMPDEHDKVVDKEKSKDINTEENKKDIQLLRESLGSPFKQLLQFKERVANANGDGNGRNLSMDQETLLQAYDNLRNMNPGDDLLASASQINDLYDLLYPNLKSGDVKSERIMQDYRDLVRQRAKILKHIQDNYTNTVPTRMPSISQSQAIPETEQYLPQQRAENVPQRESVKEHDPVSSQGFRPIPMFHHPAIFEQKDLMAYGEAKQDDQIVSAAKELNAMIEELKKHQIQSLPPELVRAALGGNSSSTKAVPLPPTNTSSSAVPEQEVKSLAANEDNNQPSVPHSSSPVASGMSSVKVVSKKPISIETGISLPPPSTSAPLSPGGGNNQSRGGTVDILNKINELRAKQMTTLEKIPSSISGGLHK